MKRLLLTLILILMAFLSFIPDSLAETPQEAGSKMATPAWKSAIESHEIDELTKVDGHGILVGQVGLSADLVPYYGPYVLYDEHTGSKKWEYQRAKPFTNNYSIISTSPVILFSTNSDKAVTYIAIDPATSRELWSHKFSLNQTATLDPLLQLLIVAEDVKGILSYKAIKLTTGDEQWKASDQKKDSGENILPQLIVCKNLLISINKDIVCRELIDGKINWSLPDAGPLPSTSLPLRLTDSIVIPSSNRKLYRIGLNGDTLWQTTFDREIGILTADEKRLFIQTIENGQPNQIRCLNLTDGNNLWVQKLEGFLTSQLLSAEGKICYTMKNTQNGANFLAIREALTGSLKSATELPPQLEWRLPDYLIPYPGQVVLVQERGVGSYRLSDGKKLWFHMLCAPSDTYYERCNSLKWFLEEKYHYFAYKAGIKVKQMPDRFNFASFEQASQNMVPAALRHESKSYLDNITKTKIDYNVGNLQGLDLSKLKDNASSIGELKMYQGLERSFATMNLAIASFGLVLDNTLGAIQRSYQLALKGRLSRDYHSIEMAGVIHQNSIQGDYFLRTTAHNCNVMVVNLKNGAWREIETSPQNPNDYQMDYRLPLLLSEGKNIAIRGISLEPPSKSLLNYELKSEDFLDAAQYDPAHFYGYTDSSGKFVIKPQFEWADVFHNGMAVVILGGNMGYIDPTGKFIIKPEFDMIYSFSGDLAMIKDNGRYGFIDRSGRLVVEPRYEAAESFSNGFAPVKLNGRWGFINQNGEMVIEPQYSSVSKFTEGLARVTTAEGIKGYIDSQGQLVLKCKFDGIGSFCEGLAFCVDIKMGGQVYRCGYIDKTGKIVIKQEFDDLQGFCEGLAGAGKSNRGKAFVDGKLNLRPKVQWGFIDKSGKFVIEPQYDAVKPFCEGKAIVQLNEKYGYIDKTGKALTEIQFDEADYFSYGMAKVKLNGKYGFIDSAGKMAIEPQFDEATDFILKGLAKVWKDGKVYFINETGKPTSSPVKEVELIPVLPGKNYKAQ